MLAFIDFFIIKICSKWMCRKEYIYLNPRVPYIFLCHVEELTFFQNVVSCVLVLWIHKGYSVVKKLVRNLRIKNFWYTNIIVWCQNIILNLIVVCEKERDYYIILIILYKTTEREGELE